MYRDKLMCELVFKNNKNEEKVDLQPENGNSTNITLIPNSVKGKCF